MLTAVFILRRDTSPKLNAIAAGTIFPGEYHLAEFDVVEDKNSYSIRFSSEDGTQLLSIMAEETNSWNSQSVFEKEDSAGERYL